MEINIAIKYIPYINLNYKTINPVPGHLKSYYPQYPNWQKPYINYYKYRRGQKHIVYIAGYMFGPIAQPLIGHNNGNNADNFIIIGFIVMVQNGKDSIY